MNRTDNANRNYDPTFLHARREALVIVLLFATFCCWSLVASYCLGYASSNEAQSTAIIAGMPAWVFWGIFVPWIGVDVAAVWFCFFYMTDDDLGESDESESHNADLDQRHEGRCE